LQAALRDTFGRHELEIALSLFDLEAVGSTLGKSLSAYRHALILSSQIHDSPLSKAFR